METHSKRDEKIMSKKQEDRLDVLVISSSYLVMLLGINLWVNCYVVGSSSLESFVLA